MKKAIGRRRRTRTPRPRLDELRVSYSKKLAEDIVSWGQQLQVPPRELLVVATMAGRILRDSCLCPAESMAVAMEADAEFRLAEVQVIN